jgi:hypothetical protein
MENDGSLHKDIAHTHYLPFSDSACAAVKTSSCKYLGIIIRNDLSWADQVNYTVQKAWKALHFVMRVLKKGNSNTKSLAYTSLVRLILEYGAACWDPYREGQINALEHVQKKAAKFAIGHNHRNGSDWESLAQRRMTARLCALFKAYTGSRPRSRKL